MAIENGEGTLIALRRIVETDSLWNATRRYIDLHDFITAQVCTIPSSAEESNSPTQSANSPCMQFRKTSFDARG